jgi:hypothetical protein
MENQIYNTYSKRNLTINGQQYKNLLKQGFYVKNNKLYAPNNYVSVKSQPKKSPVKNSPHKKIISNNALPVLNEDVIHYLGTHTYDIDFIINKCKTSKAEWKKCSTKVFWAPILEYNNIYMPKENFNTTEAWITYIKKAILIEEKLKKIMDMVENLSSTSKLSIGYDDGYIYIRKNGNVYNFAIWLYNDMVVDKYVTYDQLREFIFDSYYGGEMRL